MNKKSKAFEKVNGGSVHRSKSAPSGLHHSLPNSWTSDCVPVYSSLQHVSPVHCVSPVRRDVSVSFDLSQKTTNHKVMPLDSRCVQTATCEEDESDSFFERGVPSPARCEDIQPEKSEAIQPAKPQPAKSEDIQPAKSEEPAKSESEDIQPVDLQPETCWDGVPLHSRSAPYYSEGVLTILSYACMCIIFLRSV